MATPAALAPPAVANIQPALAPTAMTGKMGLVVKYIPVQLVPYIMLIILVLII